MKLQGEPFMNTFLILFIFLTIITILAWVGRYRLSAWLFIFFLIISSGIFFQDMTTQLSIQL